MDWLQLLSSLIAILLLALWAAKLFPVAEGLTEERVRKAYKRYAPDSDPDTLIISKNGKASLLSIVENSCEIGVITQLGDRQVCRTLTPATDFNWSIDSNTLCIRHGDFTQPAIKLELEPEELELARKILVKFEEKSGEQHAA